MAALWRGCGLRDAGRASARKVRYPGGMDKQHRHPRRSLTDWRPAGDHASIRPLRSSRRRRALDRSGGNGGSYSERRLAQRRHTGVEAMSIACTIT